MCKFQGLFPCYKFILNYIVKPKKKCNDFFRMYGYLPELECPSRRGVILFDFPGYDVIGDVISFNADLNNC